MPASSRIDQPSILQRLFDTMKYIKNMIISWKTADVLVGGVAGGSIALGMGATAPGLTFAVVAGAYLGHYDEVTQPTSRLRTLLSAMADALKIPVHAVSEKILDPLGEFLTQYESRFIKKPGELILYVSKFLQQRSINVARISEEHNEQLLKAVAALNVKPPPSENSGNLEQEVESLKKENESLKKQLKEFKSKQEKILERLDTLQRSLSPVAQMDIIQDDDDDHNWTEVEREEPSNQQALRAMAREQERRTLPEIVDTTIDVPAPSI